MCNRSVTYTADHWMKDLIRKLMGLSHEMWLARNLMKHQSTQGASAIRTLEELKEEVDKAHHHDYQNIEEKDRWLLDLDEAEIMNMKCSEVQYAIFELEALEAQDKLVAKRTGGKTRCWETYIKMCGEGVPVDNIVDGEGSLKEPEGEEDGKEAVRETKKARGAAPNKGEPRGAIKDVEKPPRRDEGNGHSKRTKAGRGRGCQEDFLRWEPSASAMVRDSLGLLGRGVIPRATGRVIAILLNERPGRGEASETMSRMKETEWEQKPDRAADTPLRLELGNDGKDP